MGTVLCSIILCFYLIWINLSHGSRLFFNGVLQQAQTYFAGQSRYVGVYDTSRLAARAYVVVQEYLRQYRSDNTLTKESPKEELATIFASARRAADEAVRELKDNIK